jgi:hypothetical protein
LRRLPRFVAGQNIAVDHPFSPRWRLDHAEEALSRVRPKNRRQWRVFDAMMQG